MRALRARFSVPEGRDEETHVALTRLAVHLAVERHCGTLEPLYTGGGITKVHHVDYKVTNILGIVGSTTTVVWGE